jgi:hypothetical protein
MREVTHRTMLTQALLPLSSVKSPGSQGKYQSWTNVTTWSPSLTLTWTWTIR